LKGPQLEASINTIDMERATSRSLVGQDLNACRFDASQAPALCSFSVQKAPITTAAIKPNQTFLNEVGGKKEL
jgi:hypothetical protein